MNDSIPKSYSITEVDIRESDIRRPARGDFSDSVDTNVSVSWDDGPEVAAAKFYENKVSRLSTSVLVRISAKHSRTHL